MGSISASTSARDLEAFVGLTKKQVFAAAASALNRSAVTAQKEAVRIVRERDKVRASSAKAQITVVKASPRQGERMRAALRLKSGISLIAATQVRDVTVIAYAGRKVVPIFQGKGKPPAFRMVDGQRKGVVVKGVDVSDRAFRAKVKSGKTDIFVRRGDKRLPIKALRTKGPINSNFFDEPVVRQRISTVFHEAFRKNFDAEIAYRRKKGAD